MLKIVLLAFLGLAGLASAGEQICHGNVDTYICPRGWTKNYNMCYKNFKQRKNWADADAFCATKGGYLVSIHSQYENGVIHGLANANPGSTWIGGRSATGQFNWYWQDYSEFCYTHWHPGQPDSKSQLCVTINWQRKASWDNNNCKTKLPFVCEIDLNDAPEKNEYKAPSEGSSVYVPKLVRKCEKGYGHMHGNRCYKPVNQAMDWYKASAFCGRHDGWLVSVPSANENLFLRGLRDATLKKNGDMWVGMFRGVDSKVWEYTDKSKVKSIPWGKGEPNGEYLDCVMMEKSGGFSNQHCGKKSVQKPFICYSKVIQYTA